MILVIGGAGSGKLSYIRSLGYGESDISCDAASGAPVMYALEESVQRAPESIEQLFRQLENKEVISCCEVGSGVIPAEKSQRIAREATGRLCVLLAQRSEKVVRLICGVPQIIKG